MNLRYELSKVDRANKANPNRERLLLGVCERYVPDERKNALTFVTIMEWIDKTWTEYAKENGLKKDAFRKHIIENDKDIASLMKW